MALHTTPEDHAANPPESWQVVKVAPRAFDLRQADGSVFKRFTTRREAEEHKVSGFFVDLYRKEGRWFAGEPVYGWKPYRPPLADKVPGTLAEPAGYVLVRTTPGGYTREQGPVRRVRDAAALAAQVLTDNTRTSRADGQRFAALLDGTPVGQEVAHEPTGYRFRVYLAGRDAAEVASESVPVSPWADLLAARR